MSGIAGDSVRAENGCTCIYVYPRVAIRPPTLYLTCSSKIKEHVKMCKDSDGAMQGKIHRALNDIIKIRDDRFISFELVYQLNYKYDMRQKHLTIICIKYFKANFR